MDLTVHVFERHTRARSKGTGQLGTGSSHGLVFLKKIWHEHMNMEEVGELGYFIIKYIQRFELDLTVGVDNLAKNFK